MAGMFYSLQETAEKLGTTEDEVKQLATDGKLREFRDGSNLLFKVEEVNSLLSGDMDMGMDLDLEPEAAATDLGEAMEPEPVAEEPVEEEPAEEEAVLELDEETPLEEVTPDMELSADLEADTAGEMGLAPDLEAAADTSAEFSEDDIVAGMADTNPAPQPQEEEEEEEISLAPETGMLGAESDITDMDTALTGEGINVLGESDADYDVTDDSLAETVGPAGTSTEASLEEIEDDVNLDSFGSGSGLLDLSLQADDTSLGGILDEIYTADGGEEAGAPGDSDLVDDMATEADHVAADEELGAPEAMVAMPAMATAYVEAAPDTQSNMLGILLFLPLLALLYTAIVVAAGLKGVMPSILESVQGMVWYIMGGAAVVAALVVGASFVVGAEKAPRAPKAKKAKKEKAPKEKKAKKEKPAKAAKPKKEKKALFGKKK